MENKKPILCLDFDGVIHDYTTGWQGADVCRDDPVEGFVSFLEQAVEVFDVQIYSSRSGQPGGINAMREFVLSAIEMYYPYVPGEPSRTDRLFDAVGWPTEKPPAFLTIDDRAMLFTGEWPDVSALLDFKPWNKG